MFKNEPEDCWKNSKTNWKGTLSQCQPDEEIMLSL